MNAILYLKPRPYFQACSSRIQGKQNQILLFMPGPK